MSKVHDNKGYCGECGNYSKECKTLDFHGMKQKVCKKCREAK